MSHFLCKDVLSASVKWRLRTFVSLVKPIELQHCIWTSTLTWTDVDLPVPADIPKFLTNHTIFYSWEGNPVNISCDVMSNPPATMLWKRERFTISAEATANTRVHSAPGKSVLEVGPAQPSHSEFSQSFTLARSCFFFFLQMLLFSIFHPPAAFLLALTGANAVSGTCCLWERWNYGSKNS